ncbi:Trigger factor [Gossypium australe]|uniref:Trigger factor n=1 Tax=Gossypium australe TaxID=47621 RepID=A0A5B6U8Q3_9ROSI|nr:Trigger factor [Gossypium australe]
MACTSMAAISLNFQHFRNHRVSFSSCCCFNRKIKLHENQQILSRKYRRKPISALASGLEASISDADDKLIALKDAKIVVESKDENKIQVMP